MPYDSDSSVPEHVKKMAPKRRRQWRHVWNSMYSRTGSEERAFKAANAVAGRKDLEDDSDDELLFDVLLDAADELWEEGDLEAELAPTLEREAELAIAAAGSKETILSRIRRWLGGEPGGAGSDGWTTANPTFSVRSMPDGSMRFFTRSTNNFKDREGEIWPAAVHEKAIEFADLHRDYPSLTEWHTPGLEFGQVDWMDFDGHYLNSGGDIFPGKEQIALSYALDPTMGMSHGHFVGYKDGGEGSGDREAAWYLQFEQSTLPLSVAANPWAPKVIVSAEGKTISVSGLEGAMAFSDQKRAFFAQKMKERGVQESSIGAEIALLERQSEEMAKAVQQYGISYKDFVEDPTPAPTLSGAGVGGDPSGGEGGEGATTPAAVSPGVPATTSTPVAAAAPLTADEVRQIASEAAASAATAAVEKALEPTLAGVKELQGAVAGFKEGADAWFSKQWGSKLSELPKGFSPSESGSTVVGTKEGAGPGGANDYSWLVGDEGMIPGMLGAAVGAGAVPPGGGGSLVEVPKSGAQNGGGQ